MLRREMAERHWILLPLAVLIWYSIRRMIRLTTYTPILPSQIKKEHISSERMVSCLQPTQMVSLCLSKGCTRLRFLTSREVSRC